jgi:hypothetical protein
MARPSWGTLQWRKVSREAWSAQRPRRRSLRLRGRSTGHGNKCTLRQPIAPLWPPRRISLAAAAIARGGSGHDTTGVVAALSAA